jgi:predicted Zn finger-like uncharacterized protein
MIITCINCEKKFNIDEAMIPKNGRLLQCSSCNHRWFYKNEILSEFINPAKKENLEIFENKNISENKTLDIDTNIAKLPKNVLENVIPKDEKKVKKNNFLNLTLVFLISFIALIVLLDTLKYPISKFIPNIDFLLYNLYESVEDLLSFIRDLI